MKILAFDTGTDFLGLALWDDGLIADLSVYAPRRHSEILPEFAGFVLRSAGVSVEDLDAVGIAIGPGSYTGLRVGIAFVQGLCLAAEVKAIPVDSLLAQAWRFNTNPLPIAVVADARAERIYGGLFDVSQEPKSIIPSALWKLKDFAARLSSMGDVILWGIDAEKFSAQMQSMVRETNLIVPEVPFRACAGAVAQIATEMHSRGEQIHPEELEPKYLRDFVPKKRTSKINRP